MVIPKIPDRTPPDIVALFVAVGVMTAMALLGTGLTDDAAFRHGFLNG